MGRGSSRDLVRKILHSLKDGPKTVSDLATAADTTWESTKQYLESLRSAGLVIEQQDGNKRIFSLKISDRRPDVYFGLPLKPEYEKKIDSLFNKITASNRA
jgi:DNA-binding transcriptional ArsR family regulator